MIYYNEFNKESAAMIQQFMDDGLIAYGDIDTRPIQEVKADDIKHYTQCHFFAGIAGWTFALQLAGWPADRSVWTGSCPCQPFSSAGRQKGKADERHLWPVWERLISQCLPSTIFGEQTATAVAHGWLDDVYEGLEKEGYAVGSAVLPASSVGAPHKRNRIWFVGHSKHDGYPTTKKQGSNEKTSNHWREEGKNLSWKSKGTGGFRYVSSVQGSFVGKWEKCSRTATLLANTKQQRLEGCGGLIQKYGEKGQKTSQRHPWEGGVWLDCPDGKQRLTEPGTPLLADGFQHRKPILHALGNAIVPQIAAEFIKATQ